MPKQKDINLKTKTGSLIIIDGAQLQKMHDAARALMNPLRIKILAELNGKEKCVSELYAKLKIEQSVCSQMLKVLRDAGIVQSERRGKKRFYSIDGEGATKIQFMASHA